MRRTGIAALLALASAVPAAASGGPDEGGLGDLLWPALNLAILLAALIYFGRRPVRDFFAARRGRIREELDAAARALSDAEARYREWERKLSGIDAEMARIQERARERAAAEREQILAEASAAAERIRGDARAAVEQELRRAREQLRGEAAGLAIEIAAQTLRARVSDADRSRLVDEFIETVERGRSTAPARPEA